MSTPSFVLMFLRMKAVLCASVLVVASAYKAAYVEHTAVSPCGQGSCGRQQKAASVRAYDAYALQASRQGAQIIVFPEYGITGFSSYPKSSWLSGGYTETLPAPQGQVPCDEAQAFHQAPSVVSLSCSARKHSIAIVANLVEYTQGKLYNTNVAIDTDGTFLARYRKRNLWGEANIDVPPAEAVSFTTKFGETFGMFTCADLIYQHPALDLVAKGIKNFVMPLAWSNEMAQMQSLAYAQGWSLANKVNLVLANHRTGSESGSAILVSGNPVSQFYRPADSAGPVQVGEVSTATPKASLRSPMARLDLSRLSSEAAWKFGAFGSQVCSGGMCCSATATSGSSKGYLVAALDGTDTDDGVRWPAQVCAVLPCRQGMKCLAFQQPTGNLKGVNITMTGSNSVSVVPEVLGSSGGGEVLLTPGDALSFECGQGSASVTVNSPVTLLSAVIYGRPSEKPLVMV